MQEKLSSPANPGTEQGSSASVREGLAQGVVSGWRLLLALVTWIALSVAAGVVTWAGLDAVAPTWGGTDGRVLIVVAEVYLAPVCKNLV